jgi:hypothetical protein
VAADQAAAGVGWSRWLEGSSFVDELFELVASLKMARPRLQGLAATA